MSAKVQISIDEGLLARLDEFADRNFCTRSGAVSMAVSQLVLQDELQRSLRTMALAMQRIAENGELDEQSKNDMKQIQALMQIMSQSKYSTF
jgi:metal-responsive CopG/Arc/MetJ family transcriptional regulator